MQCRGNSGRLVNVRAQGVFLCTNLTSVTGDCRVSDAKQVEAGRGHVVDMSCFAVQTA